MIATVRKYSKAIGAGVASAVALVVNVLPDGITSTEWTTLVGGFALIVLVVIAAPANQTPATDAVPVTVPQADASGTVVGQVVVPGPSATIAHYEPPSRLDVLDGVGRRSLPEQRTE